MHSHSLLSTSASPGNLLSDWEFYVGLAPTPPAKRDRQEIEALRALEIARKRHAEAEKLYAPLAPHVRRVLARREIARLAAGREKRGAA